MTDPAAPGCPVQHTATKSGDLTYGSYLQVDALLNLQQLQVPGGSHDELLFITIHQAYELWFKQVLFEVDTVARLMANDDLHEARRLLDRVIAIERLLVDQIHLLETMTPRDFCHFRRALTPASGFQSIQFRELTFVSGLKDPGYLRFLHREEDISRLRGRLDAPSLRDHLYALLRRQGFVLPADPDADETTQLAAAQTLVPLYRDSDQHAALYALCEALVAHDQWLATWRFHHVRVVERIIGNKPGTGGSPGVRYLESTVPARAFPVLWIVRSLLDEDALFATYHAP